MKTETAEKPRAVLGRDVNEMQGGWAQDGEGHVISRQVEVRNGPAHLSVHPTTQGFSQVVLASQFAIKEMENCHIWKEEGTRKKKKECYAMLSYAKLILY